MKNFYPGKPLYSYRKTTVPMQLVIKYLQALKVSVEVKRAAYILFRNESMNGQKGVCENYAGIQADSGKWPDKFDSLIIGTTKVKENQTGKERLFCVFRDFTASVDFLADRVQARGLYVGGKTHKILTMDVPNEKELARAYYKEWVKGDPKAEPSKEALSNFLSMYNQAKVLFT